MPAAARSAGSATDDAIADGSEDASDERTVHHVLITFDELPGTRGANLGELASEAFDDSLSRGNLVAEHVAFEPRDRQGRLQAPRFGREIVDAAPQAVDLRQIV